MSASADLAAALIRVLVSAAPDGCPADPGDHTNYFDPPEGCTCPHDPEREET